MKKILIVDDDPVMRKLVSGLLVKNGYQVSEAVDGKEGLAQVINFSPDLIVSDVLMPEMDGYDFCAEVRSRPEGKSLPIMMLTALDSVEQKIKGFEVGVDDYLVKPFEPKEFVARVSALIRRSVSLDKTEVEGRSAQTIGVFSLRGGAGVSTIAANTAIGLSQIWNQPTTLIDLVLVGGQSALFLNQPLKNTWAEICKSPLDEIDDHIVQGALLSHDSGVTTLAAPKRPEVGDTITPEKVSKVLSILKDNNEYLVIDFPHDFSGTTLAGLDLSDIIFIVAQPEIVSVRSATIAKDTFIDLGYNPDNIKTIINWTFPRNGIVSEDIERYIKSKIDLVIPYATDEFVEAINFGIPPAFSHPEEPLGALFEDLAMAVSKDDHRKDKPEEPAEGWLRVVDRVKQRRRTK